MPAGQNKGILGSIAGIFDEGPEIDEVLYNEALKKYITKDLLPVQKEDLANRRTAQNLFAQRIQEATPEQQRVTQERLDYLRKILPETAGFNPFESLYRPLGDYLFNRIDSVAPKIAGLTRGIRSSDQIAAGIRPGGTSSHLESRVADSISRGLAPLYSDVVRTVGPDFSRLAMSRDSERLAGLGILDRLGAEPDRLAFRELLPAQVAQELQAGDIGNAQRLIEAYKSNVAGFKATPSLAGRVSEGLGGIYNSVIETANTAANLLGSFYGMGGMSGVSGMFGGGGGGGGKPAVPTGNTAGAGQDWTGPIGPPAPSYAYAPTTSQPGGGINMAQLMQWFQMMQGSRNPYLSPSPAY